MELFLDLNIEVVPNRRVVAGENLLRSLDTNPVSRDVIDIDVTLAQIEDMVESLSLRLTPENFDDFQNLLALRGALETVDAL